MDAFYESLITRAATIDELLSDDFEAAPPQEGDPDLAAQRLEAWCRAAANGDWEQFRRRLARDGWTYEEVKARLARVRYRAPTSPLWIADAIWIEHALRSDAEPQQSRRGPEPRPFEDFLLPLVDRAEALVGDQTGTVLRDDFTASGLLCLRLMLLDQLSTLCAPPLYERFAAMRDQSSTDSAPATTPPGTALYDRFVVDMKAGGLRRLFEEKPVLLRLIATLTRQWIDFVSEFARRLDADMLTVRKEFAGRDGRARVTAVDGGLSDHHNRGRSVLIVTFEDDTRVVYKPKDLGLDVRWHEMVTRLNRSQPPVQLRAVRALACAHYGWTEYVAHTPCLDDEGCKSFFRRAGAWLALFHCFAATDMHQENMIASGDQPVPIDLETILQLPPAASKPGDTGTDAVQAASDLIANSVMAVGILPAYGRAPDTSVFAMGALTADWNVRFEVAWHDINTDAMRPFRRKKADSANPNLPHVGGRYAKLGDHVSAFTAGFEDYARFLSQHTRGAALSQLFDDFAGAPVRKVLRPTRFYSMLLQRLKAHKTMDDGATWSAQADFIARLSDWDVPSDPLWPFKRAERSALLDLNIPHFVVPSDGHVIGDADGPIAALTTISGLERARERTEHFDGPEIAWQTEVIRAHTIQSKPAEVASPPLAPAKGEIPASDAQRVFVAESDRIAAEIAQFAIRRGTSAAWIGLDWLGDAQAYQLAVLGPDLYNGASGIAVFLAAHSIVAKHPPSGELALAALSHLRSKLKDANAPRFARSLGLGGATGLGSIVYALAVISKGLRDPALLADAHTASTLMTDDLIAADRRLDALGGSAGAILALLRLYRDTGTADVLDRAIKCGEHLLQQNRIGPDGRRSWIGYGLGPNPLNGMSHGAAGFSYALASLAVATDRDDFAQAAAEALAFENSSYDADRHNWPDKRHPDQPGWACRWCHGAPGIGLARAGLIKRSAMDPELMRGDIDKALAGAEQAWPTEIDTLCCGTLGNVEFFCEAADALGRPDIRKAAAARLAVVIETARARGDYRWNSGKRQFNLGLFRGLAGVGYTLLRQRDPSLPNVLIWE
ncbi:type 2 lanthipeptide synthetase LanM family protein [Pseudorhodoplanes sp.]|uniref:type 2 lanthipeptide synthetase LanM family protein n=1 Tax=Pseudorhodoplanes sp. TaxID=1934341 RepID=UPI002BDA7C7B|nr:type 2 lanthipeptide synthetase LanM family protein [Pseudorhodoplanes sp.]HWV42887.1 type 2 lanthipeptide synthetase LanM family protein [Pseudorhodoplanes sp.]